MLSFDRIFIAILLQHVGLLCVNIRSIFSILFHWPWPPSKWFEDGEKKKKLSVIVMYWLLFLMLHWMTRKHKRDIQTTFIHKMHWKTANVSKYFDLSLYLKIALTTVLSMKNSEYIHIETEKWVENVYWESKIIYWLPDTLINSDLTYIKRNENSHEL